MLTNYFICSLFSWWRLWHLEVTNWSWICLYDLHHTILYHTSPFYVLQVSQDLMYKALDSIRLFDHWNWHDFNYDIEFHTILVLKVMAWCIVQLTTFLPNYQEKLPTTLENFYFPGFQKWFVFCCCCFLIFCLRYYKKN